MEVRKVVRLLEADINGELPVISALRKIKGISFMFSKSVCLAAGIESRKKIGLLNAEELKSLENAIKDPKLPVWLLNRRKDLETGENRHLIGSQLDMRKREDINILKRIRAYKGIRHELGQPVRGQRTRSSFRTQKTVGVSKKAARMQPKKEEK